MVAGTIPSELGKLVQLSILYSRLLVYPLHTHASELVAIRSMRPILLVVTEWAHAVAV
jgi:hypothetical protein